MSTSRLYARKIICSGGMASGTAVVITARVYMTHVQIPFTMTVNSIGFKIGGTVAGNVRVGIYADNGDTPAGGALVVESASVAKGAAWQVQEVAVPSTQLKPGSYWIAIQSDENTTLFHLKHQTEDFNATLIGKQYDRGGGYGAFTDPCPASGNLQSVYAMFLMVTSVP